MTAIASIGETWQALRERLLDQAIGVTEAASLLGVCIATVRRYTNRGILRCFRNPGGQRRFYLSEVHRFINERKGVN